MTEIEKIQEYLSGSMNNQDKEEFEKLINSDVELALRVQETRDAIDAVRDLGRIELKTKLEEFESSYSDQNQEKIKSNWSKSLMGIAAILIIGFGLYFGLYSNNEFDKNTVFAEYYHSYPSFSNNRSSSNQFSDWERAMNEYENKEFELAITIMEKINSEEIPEYLIQFYLAHSYLSLPNPDLKNSEINFDKVIQSENDFVQQSLWFKALIEIKKGNDPVAKKMMKTIAEKKSFNHEKAQEILNEYFD